MYVFLFVSASKFINFNLLYHCFLSTHLQVPNEKVNVLGIEFIERIG